jgi:hypothetical protein
VPHQVIVEALVETLSFRHIRVVNEEYAVSFDGMKMFGILDRETRMDECRFSIDEHNWDYKPRLGLTAGLRLFVCSNMVFSGDFKPVLAKHSESLSHSSTATRALHLLQVQRNPPTLSLAN